MRRRQEKALYCNTWKLSAKELSKETNRWWNQSALHSSIIDHLYIFCCMTLTGTNNPFGFSSVIVGENSAVFGKNAPSSDDEDDADRIEKGAAAFNSSWLPGSDSKYVFLSLEIHTSGFHMVNHRFGVVDYGVSRGCSSKINPPNTSILRLGLWF